MADVDSSTGGYLLPAESPAPAEDLELDAVFQQLVRNVTGVQGDLVRPRWQDVTPKQPEANVDWCAVAVVRATPDANPVVEHVSEGEGTDLLQRHEALTVGLTFYGPHAKKLAGVFRDGLYIAQNREALTAVDVSFVECSEILPAPEFVNQKWIRGQNMSARFNRKVMRTYAVRNVKAADIHLFDDTHIDETIYVPPSA